MHARVPQPIERVLNWGCQIASALAAAHANRIVHRDLKPENMIVRKADDSIKIVDFGLARHITFGQESSRSLPAGGTIDYFSPEQVAGQKPTDASDIFAVGTILYELATGQHPFPGETPLDRLYSIGTHQPEPASSVQAGIPKEIDSLLAAMLSKQPVDRPSAAGAEQALSRALRPDTAQPRKTGPRRLPALAAAVLALAAVVVGYLGFVRQSPVDSIAVLPFRHADPSMDYLSDGLRHEIALGLALTRGLRVAGNTNIAKYKEENLDVRKSGRELGVASLLRGDLNRNGKLIQLDLELLDTKTGAQLWSGEFQQPDTGIATFSHEVSGRIAAKLVARVVVPAQMPANRNPEAYEAYLRGRYHFIRRTRQDMALAAEHAERAVQLDPKFAEAWSLLAASQGFTPGMYNSLSPQELYAKTRGAIDRAIAIDPDLPEGHLTLGGVIEAREWMLVMAATARLKISDLNAMSRELFIATVGPAYQGQSGMAERVAGQRPFEDAAGLRRAMRMSARWRIP